MRAPHLALVVALVSAPVASANAGLLEEISATVTGDNPEVPSHGYDLETVIRNMQAAYNQTQDFTAEFEQQYINGALGDTSVSSGVVHFMRPGRMRWDYVEPRERYFISDGENLWIYEPEEGQYYTAPLEDSDLPTALRFLMGEGEFSQDFTIAFSDIEALGVISIDLVPIRSEGEYQSLRFVLDPNTWQVEQATIVDPVGNTNTFTFTNRQNNVGYQASDFTFEPPRGAVQIETPEGGI